MSADTNATLGVSAIKRHEKYYFRDGNICFLVENTLFRLHRYFFERESEYFSDRLEPSGDGEDGSPNSPYIIHDVKLHEFADFVWVWYNPRYSFSKQDKQKWLTILRLAALWSFDEIRKLAIRQLEKMELEPIEKITIYRQYSVNDELLLPSYVSLCTSPTLPSPEEGRRLTLETVLRLASARERVLLRAAELGCKTPTIASAPEDIIKAVVSELFDLTIHSNGPDVGVGGQVINNRNAPGDGPAKDPVVTVKQPTPTKTGKTTGLASPEAQPTSTTNGVGRKGKYRASGDVPV